jgi:hypothetical protein
MAYMFAHPAGRAVATSALVLDAARCWRAARDGGHSVQPCLTAILRDHECEMLAPCFDSLMALAEAALGRPLHVGDGGALSEDEHLLLDLLDGTRRTRACLDCHDVIATVLDGALCSIRSMMALVLPGLSERGALS